jgi:hypothetical protein
MRPRFRSVLSDLFEPATVRAANSAGELDVFHHDRHTLPVDRAEVGILEEVHLSCF